MQLDDCRVSDHDIEVFEVKLTSAPPRGGHTVAVAAAGLQHGFPEAQGLISAAVALGMRKGLRIMLQIDENPNQCP